LIIEFRDSVSQVNKVIRLHCVHLDLYGRGSLSGSLGITVNVFQLDLSLIPSSHHSDGCTYDSGHAKDVSSVAVQRFEGIESVRLQNIQMTALRSKWSEESANQSVAAWLTTIVPRVRKVGGYT
jgi:hypothetical protein